MTHSERMRRLWADPEWSARQREKISEAAQARWAWRRAKSARPNQRLAVSVSGDVAKITRLPSGAVLLEPMRFIPVRGA